MFTSAFNERSGSNPLCDFRLGTVVTSDYETPLTGYEPKKDLNLVNTEELDLAATCDVYWQHTLDDDASLNDPDVDDNQLAKYLAVVVDSTGKPVETRSNNDQFSCDTRNLKSAQNQFPFRSSWRSFCSPNPLREESFPRYDHHLPCVSGASENSACVTDGKQHWR